MPTPTKPESHPWLEILTTLAIPIGLLFLLFGWGSFSSTPGSTTSPFGLGLALLGASGFAAGIYTLKVTDRFQRWNQGVTWPDRAIAYLAILVGSTLIVAVWIWRLVSGDIPIGGSRPATEHSRPLAPSRAIETHQQPSPDKDEKRVSERALAGWSFLLQWLLANIVAWPIVTVALIFSVDLVFFMPVSILIVGILQWFVLRKHISQTGWWIGASALGLILGLATALVLSKALDLFITPMGVGGGLLVAAAAVAGWSGILQWLVLRPQVLQAGWWVLVSPLAAGLGGASVGLQLLSEFDNLVAPSIMFGLLYGIMTGIFLVWLLRQPASRTVSA